MSGASNPSDYYDILGVSRSASTAGIVRAYEDAVRRINERTPPASLERENAIKEVYDAYQVLGSPGTRAAYDRFGHAFASAAKTGKHMGSGPEFGTSPAQSVPQPSIGTRDLPDLPGDLPSVPADLPDLTGNPAPIPVGLPPATLSGLSAAGASTDHISAATIWAAVAEWLKNNIKAAAIAAGLGAAFGFASNFALLYFRQRLPFVPAANPGSIAAAGIWWMLASTVIGALGGYWWSVGTEKFFKTAIQFPTMLASLFRAGGGSARVHLLWGLGIALLVSAVISPAIGAVVAVVLIVGLPSVFGGFISNLLFRLWSTLVALVSPTKRRPLDGAIMMAIGIMGSVLALSMGSFVSDLTTKVAIAGGCLVLAVSMSLVARQASKRATLCLLLCVLGMLVSVASANHRPEPKRWLAASGTPWLPDDAKAALEQRLRDELVRWIPAWAGPPTLIGHVAKFERRAIVRIAQTEYRPFRTLDVLASRYETQADAIDVWKFYAEHHLEILTSRIHESSQRNWQPPGEQGTYIISNVRGHDIRTSVTFQHSATFRRGHWVAQVSGGPPGVVHVEAVANELAKFIDAVEPEFRRVYPGYEQKESGAGTEAPFDPTVLLMLALIMGLASGIGGALGAAMAAALASLASGRPWWEAMGHLLGDSTLDQKPPSLPWLNLTNEQLNQDASLAARMYRRPDGSLDIDGINRFFNETYGLPADAECPPWMDEDTFENVQRLRQLALSKAAEIHHLDESGVEIPEHHFSDLPDDPDLTVDSLERSEQTELDDLPDPGIVPSTADTEIPVEDSEAKPPQAPVNDELRWQQEEATNLANEIRERSAYLDKKKADLHGFRSSHGWESDYEDRIAQMEQDIEDEERTLRALEARSRELSVPPDPDGLKTYEYSQRYHAGDAGNREHAVNVAEDALRVAAGTRFKNLVSILNRVENEDIGDLHQLEEGWWDPQAFSFALGPDIRRNREGTLERLRTRIDGLGSVDESGRFHGDMRAIERLLASQAGEAPVVYGGKDAWADWSAAVTNATSLGTGQEVADAVERGGGVGDMAQSFGHGLLNLATFGGLHGAEEGWENYWAHGRHDGSVSDHLKGIGQMLGTGAARVADNTVVPFTLTSTVLDKNLTTEERVVALLLAGAQIGLSVRPAGELGVAAARTGRRLAAGEISARDLASSLRQGVKGFVGPPDVAAQMQRARSFITGRDGPGLASTRDEGSPRPGAARHPDEGGTPRLARNRDQGGTARPTRMDREQPRPARNVDEGAQLKSGRRSEEGAQPRPGRNPEEGGQPRPERNREDGGQPRAARNPDEAGQPRPPRGPAEAGQHRPEGRSLNEPRQAQPGRTLAEEASPRRPGGLDDAGSLPEDPVARGTYVRNALRDAGVREELVRRMGYQHGSPGKHGLTRFDPHGPARGWITNKAFEKGPPQVKSTALHEVDHILQNEQIKVRGRIEGLTRQSGNVSRRGENMLEMETRMRDLDRNIQIRDRHLAERDRAIREAGANHANPDDWPPRAREAQAKAEAADRIVNNSRKGADKHIQKLQQANRTEGDINQILRDRERGSGSRTLYDDAERSSSPFTRPTGSLPNVAELENAVVKNRSDFADTRRAMREAIKPYAQTGEIQSASSLRKKVAMAAELDPANSELPNLLKRHDSILADGNVVKGRLGEAAGRDFFRDPSEYGASHVLGKELGLSPKVRFERALNQEASHLAKHGKIGGNGPDDIYVYKHPMTNEHHYVVSEYKYAADEITFSNRTIYDRTTGEPVFVHKRDQAGRPVYDGTTGKPVYEKGSGTYLQGSEEWLNHQVLDRLRQEGNAYDIEFAKVLEQAHSEGRLHYVKVKVEHTSTGRLAREIDHGPILPGASGSGKPIRLR